MNVEELMNKLAKALTEGKIKSTDNVLLYADELREPIYIEAVTVQIDLMVNKRQVILTT
jgi:hypothetical protein